MAVLLHALDDDPIIQRGIYHFDPADTQLSDLLDDRFGERLESAGDDHAFVFVGNILDQDLIGQVLALFRVLNVQIFDLVKQAKDFFVIAPGLAFLALGFRSVREKRELGKK